WVTFAVFAARKKWWHSSGSIHWRKARAKRKGWGRSANTDHGLFGICWDRPPRPAEIKRSDSSIPRLAVGKAAPKQKWQRPASSLLTATSCFVMRSVTRNLSGGAKLACARGRESWAETPQSLEA